MQIAMSVDNLGALQIFLQDAKRARACFYAVSQDKQ